MWANLIGAYKRNVHFRAEIIIFALAFLLGSAYAIILQLLRGSHAFISFSDAEFFYLREALNIVAHHSFSLATSAPWYPNAYHTPLYPLFAAFFFALKQPLITIMIVQNCLAGLAGVFAYRIGLTLTNNSRISFWAALLSSLEPMSVYWRNLLMSDFLFAFLIILAIYFLTRRSTVWSAFVMGLATLTRPIGIYFFLILAVFALIESWQASGSFKAMSKKKMTWAIVVFVAVIFPWYLRNKVVFNTWQFSSASGYELYTVVLPPFAAAEHITVPTFVPNATEPQYEFSRFNFEYVPFYEQTFKSIALAHPFAYAEYHLGRSLQSLLSDRYEYVVHFWILSGHEDSQSIVIITNIALWLGKIFWIVVYILALLSLANKKYRKWAVLIIFLVATNLLLSGLVNPDGYSMSRYMIPFVPFIFLSAFVGARVW